MERRANYKPFVRIVREHRHLGRLNRHATYMHSWIIFLVFTDGLFSFSCSLAVPTSTVCTYAMGEILICKIINGLRLPGAGDVDSVVLGMDAYTLPPGRAVSKFGLKILTRLELRH